MEGCCCGYETPRLQVDSAQPTLPRWYLDAAADAAVEAVHHQHRHTRCMKLRFCPSPTRGLEEHQSSFAERELAALRMRLRRAPDWALLEPPHLERCNIASKQQTRVVRSPTRARRGLRLTFRAGIDFSGRARTLGRPSRALASCRSPLLRLPPRPSGPKCQAGERSPAVLEIL